MNQLFDNKNIIFETNYQNDTLTMKWKFNTLFKIEELSFNLNKKTNFNGWENKSHF